MNDRRFAGETAKAIKWLMSISKDGKFGSTQGTILALKAILSYDSQKTLPEGNPTFAFGYR